ncbi:MAG: insulinase family protein [Bacteroidia bacterium]|nr:insulinase family protein [Bacteroidia bacterium]
MKKTLILSALLLITVFAVSAQDIPQLPTDPSVRIGKLDNGLTYYIRRNNYVPQRADFYIAQNVGSILEQKDQRGLAHFLEHMAFNGTKHFPGKAMINYLETIGVQFGGNLNAYTSIDETVYFMCDVPVIRTGIVDSIITILRDWSDGISLETSEIDKERGVIEEEWRTRDNFMMRMYDKVLPIIYANDKYADCMPIGNIDVIRNFKPEALRAYYDTWYRPDLQGIIVVGDIDVDQIEAKIKEIFASSDVPENAPERIYYPVSKNTEPIIVFSKDKESPITSVMISYKHDVLPENLKSTAAYVINDYVNELLTAVMDARLDEIKQAANPPFTRVGSYYSDFLVSKTKDAWTLDATTSVDNASKALKTLIIENERLRRYGITASEFERAKADMLKNLEKEFNDRDKQKNEYYVQKLVSNFKDKEPILSIDMKYQIYSQFAQMLPLDAINQMLQKQEDEGVVVWIASPETVSANYPDETYVKHLLDSISKAEIAPYQEAVLNEPLIKELPQAGKIISESITKDSVYNYVLSNGAVVEFRPTTYKQDELLFTAYSKGGYSYENKSDAITIKQINELASIGGLGSYNAIDLKKVLAGKNVSVKIEVIDYSDAIIGSSSIKDIETLFQLVYLNFTNIRSDKDAFESYISRKEAYLQNMDAYPIIELQDSLSSVLYNNHPFTTRTKASDVKNINYERALQILKQRYSNAADFRFIIVGNASPDSIKSFLTKYIAVLPANSAREQFKDAGIVTVKGNKTVHYKKQMLNPSTIAILQYTGEIPYTLANIIATDALSQILYIVYTEKVREDEGGTYGVYAKINLDAVPWNRFTANIQFSTDSTKIDKLLPIIKNEFQNIAKSGPREQDLQKVKEFMTKKYIDNKIDNEYWRQIMLEQYISGINMNDKYLETLDKIDAKTIQKLAAKILKFNNRKEIIQLGTK